MVWHSMVWMYGMICFDMVWYRLIWYDMVWYFFKVQCVGKIAECRYVSWQRGHLALAAAGHQQTTWVRLTCASRLTEQLLCHVSLDQCINVSMYQCINVVCQQSNGAEVEDHTLHWHPLNCIVWFGLVCKCKCSHTVSRLAFVQPEYVDISVSVLLLTLDLQIRCNVLPLSPPQPW